MFREITTNPSTMDETQVKIMLEEIKRVAPFSHVDAYDVQHLQPVPFSHADETSRGKLYTLRVGAWLIVINYHHGKGDDSYAEAKLMEISF